MAGETAARGEVVLSRVLQAPRDLVWRAWTEPARLAAWWGPHGFTNPLCEADARPGGAVRIDMRGPDGTVHPMTGTFREVVPPERLVFTGAALDPAGRPLFEVLNTVTFAEEGGGTLLTVRAQVLEATAGAAPHLSGQRLGWSQSLERLAALVAGVDDLGSVIVAERVFDAPVGAVYEAWTDPERLVRWWGPRRLTTRVERMDVRAGGLWRMVQRDGDGREYVFGGEFHEVEPGRRLAYTQRSQGQQALNEVAFRDLGGRTQVTVVVRFACMADREAAARSGMEPGMAESLDRLAEGLADGAEIVMTRVFPAPRALVYRMWTEPEHVTRWWGPHGFTTTIREMDVRPGGAWRFVMRGADGTEFPNDVRYIEVTRPERLVYDHLALPPQFRHHVSFTPVGAGTEVTVQMRFPSAADRDEAVRRYGALQGLGQTLDRLADLLAAQA